MRRRTRVGLFLGIALLIAAGLALWLVADRGPIDARSFERIQVGMWEEEVHSLLRRKPDYRFKDIFPDKKDDPTEALGWEGDKNIVVWVDGDGVVVKKFCLPNTRGPKYLNALRTWLGL